MSRFYYDLFLKINPFFKHALYFISVSFLGFGLLKVLRPRTEPKPRNLDLFFTSVSAVTVSSMSTVEMEVFSNEQLIVLTILMFAGGEVFTSMVELHFWRFELGKSSKLDHVKMEKNPDHIVIVSDLSHNNGDYNSSNKNLSLEYESIRFLGFVVLGYLLVIQAFGISCVLVHLSLVSSARNVLRKKGINPSTFAIFTVVSVFASCGFIPTNENMIVFRKNSGLLLILVPQILLGNTLFAPCLRFSIWVLGKIKVCEFNSEYLLKNTGVIGYYHFLPSMHSRALAGTVLGLLLVGFGLFSGMEWNSDGLHGLNTYQKVVGGVFESANVRHSGATIVDLSTVAPAVLVFFIVMMYLPPYTSFLPMKSNEEQIPAQQEKWRKRAAIQDFVLSPLSYLAIFIIAICITERERIQQDPLNFSVLNITIEVIRVDSAHVLMSEGASGLSCCYASGTVCEPSG
ncbi:hypothetical protein F511_36579 [Dorcoceras hygrometricum]|uniref:Sodium transporter HKT1-like n=1 Tax=Dorcoceras hygrometricum TaxID=472368 RepID=A0A2Z7CCH1_9LAMI|nr:hypothetical protein F511_36579 [Dorcoceras hygrometricum]